MEFVIGSNTLKKMLTVFLFLAAGLYYEAGAVDDRAVVVADGQQQPDAFQRLAAKALAINDFGPLNSYARTSSDSPRAMRRW